MNMNEITKIKYVNAIEFDCFHIEPQARSVRHDEEGHIELITNLFQFRVEENHSVE